MSDISISSLGELAAFMETSVADDREVLFRGQSQGWPLIPSLARGRRAKGDNLLQAEEEMIAEFQRHSVPHLQTVPEAIWDWLALAQHHGLPTRLIDWSENPMAALWFVVNQAPMSHVDGVLWILRPDPTDFATRGEMQSLQCERNTVFAPRHIAQRIVAQSGWFTVHKAWARNRDFTPLEESSDFGAKLTKITIPNAKFAHLRFYLDKCGINSESVYRDLDGLCDHLRWKYFYLNDEQVGVD